MPTLEIVRAWKDEEYWDRLTEDQRAQLPEHPSGLMAFRESKMELENSFGAQPLAGFLTANCTNKCCLHHTRFV